MPDKPTELEQAVRELVALQAYLDGAEQSAKLLKEKIRKLLPDLGSYPVAGVTVTLSPNRRFDPDQAAKLVPPEALPVVSVTTTKVDGDKLKALLPAIWEQAQKVYEPKVSIR